MIGVTLYTIQFQLLSSVAHFDSSRDCRRWVTITGHYNPRMCTRLVMTCVFILGVLCNDDKY